MNGSLEFKKNRTLPARRLSGRYEGWKHKRLLAWSGNTATETWCSTPSLAIVDSPWTEKEMAIGVSEMTVIGPAIVPGPSRSLKSSVFWKMAGICNGELLHECSRVGRGIWRGRRGRSKQSSGPKNRLGRCRTLTSLLWLWIGNNIASGSEETILRWTEIILWDDRPLYPWMDLDRVELWYTFYNGVWGDSTERKGSIIPVFSSASSASSSVV